MAKAPSRRAVRWLRGELPKLVSSGAITPETAAAIERYYDSAESRLRPPRNCRLGRREKQNAHVTVRVRNGDAGIEELFIDDKPLKDCLRAQQPK